MRTMQHSRKHWIATGAAALVLAGSGVAPALASESGSGSASGAAPAASAGSSSAPQSCTPAKKGKGKAKKKHSSHKGHHARPHHRPSQAEDSSQTADSLSGGSDSSDPVDDSSAGPQEGDSGGSGPSSGAHADDTSENDAESGSPAASGTASDASSDASSGKSAGPSSGGAKAGSAHAGRARMAAPAPVPLRAPAPAAGVRVTARQAVTAAVGSARGPRLLSADLTRADGRWIWEAALLAKDGTPRRLEIDAADARVVRAAPPGGPSGADDLSEARHQAELLGAARVDAGRALAVAEQREPGMPVTRIQLSEGTDGPVWDVEFEPGPGQDGRQARVVTVDARTGAVVSDTVDLDPDDS